MDDFKDLMEKEGFNPGNNNPEPDTRTPSKTEPDKTDDGSKKEPDKTDDNKKTEQPATGEDKKTEQPATGKEGNEPNKGETGKFQEADILSALNESLQTEFKSVEDIKNLMSYKDQSEQNKSELEKYQSQLQEKDEVIQKIGNPYSVFANEDVIKINEMVSKNPGMAPAAAAQLLSTDFDNLDDNKVLVMDRIREEPGLSKYSESEIMDMLNDEYRLNEYDDADEEELTEKQKRNLKSRELRKKSDADTARKELKQLTDIKTPEQKNREEEIKQENKEKAEKFTPIAQKIAQENLDKVVVGDKHKSEFQIDEGFKNWLGSPEQGQEQNRLTRYLVANYNQEDPNSYDQAVSNLKEMYLRENIHKIVDDVVESTETRMRDQFDKENHNARGKNYQEGGAQPTDASKKDQEEEQRFLKRVGR